MATVGPRGRRRSGRVTLSDVAARAGVAAITVSRALNQPETVSQPLRERITAAINALGYLPNRMAGSLASARNPMAVMIVPSLGNSVFIEVVDAVQTTLEAAGYPLLLGNSGYDPDREERLIRSLLGWSPAAAIITGLDHRPAARALLTRWGGPVVEIMEVGPQVIDMNVGLSHRQAGAAMAAHLLGRGYRRIGFAGTQLDRDVRATQRLAGLRAGLAAGGQSLHCLMTDSQTSTLSLGAPFLRRILVEHPRTDAVFFANDDLAAGAILEAQRLGIAVPERLAIAGFNGLELGAHISPALTTIHSPRARIGTVAAELVLQRLQGDTPQRHLIDLGFELLVRAST
jgi:LacI family transcriptional regulator, gluconate utilization system Gnt-I transcriptional repressor